MRILIIASALMLLGACSMLPKTIEKPVLYEKPELFLPSPKPTEQLGVEWQVITSENLPALIKEAEAKGQPLVLFGLTPLGYQNLAMNMADLRRYIEQQNAIIYSYKEYYARKQDPKAGDPRHVDR